MKLFRFILSCFLLLGFTERNVYAQMLEQNDAPTTSGAALSFDETDKNEKLFNEMFSEHSEEERDINKVKTFDDTVGQAAGILEKTKDLRQQAASEEQLPVLEGDMLVGISKGSFKVFQDMLGRTKCSFGVTLKYNMNRDMKLMAMRLVYPKRAFAFVFKNVTANSTTEKFIITSGDICYDFGGVPDIDINMCRIKGAIDTECAQRIKWSDNLLSPDPSKAPY